LRRPFEGRVVIGIFQRVDHVSFNNSNTHADNGKLNGRRVGNGTGAFAILKFAGNALSRVATGYLVELDDRK
jgi:hypothetical protein